MKSCFPVISLAAKDFDFYPIQWLGLPDIATLCIQVPLGAVIYIAGSVLLKLESFTYLWGIVKKSLTRLFRK